jgi:hypothetical protein
MLERLLEAARHALSDDPEDRREARLGAIGERADGVVVFARNSAVLDTEGNGGEPWSFGPAHAEWRLAKKLDTGAVVYVARVKKDGTIAMARPCGGCERVLRSRKVSRVYYTVNPTTYGVWDLDTDNDKTVERTDV